MKFWGITGGIGSGKSQVLAELARRGYPTIDADVVSRQVVDPAYPGSLQTLREVEKLAGSQVIASDGSLDRAALRVWMSLGDQNRAALEQVIVPSIRKEILKWMEEQKKGPQKAAFIEASRMIESGLTKILDGVLWVTAAREKRIERAAHRDARRTEEIVAIADLQLDDQGFAAHATQTLENSGSVEELKFSVTNFLSKASLLLLALLVGTPQLRAQESQEWFPSGRSRSMGLALTAIVDDHDSLHVNPAGLALIEERSLRLPDLVMASVSSSFLGVINKIRDLDSGGSTSISQQLQKFDGTASGGDFSLLGAYWNKPRLGVAVNPFGLTGSVRIRTPSLLFAKVNLYTVAQGGFTFGYAQPFLSNRLRVGLAIKPFSYRFGLRAELENQDIATVGNNFSDYSGGGWGADVDLGVQGNLDPIPLPNSASLKLMTGVALQNSFENRFSMPLIRSISNNPPATERRVNLGFAARILNPGILEPTFSVELRDLLTSYDEFLEFLHFGMEIIIRPREFYTSSLRFGFAKGNLSGGVAFKWQVFELEVGSYAVNLGPGPGIGRDRRYFLQTALEF